MGKKVKTSNLFNPTWNSYLAETWAKYLPPIRPAREELNIYERYLERESIKKGGRIDVLILGSTPELRDLCISHGLIPTVVDYNEDNYKALTTLMKQKGKEDFINQNWLELKIDRAYDMVLMEACINVVKKVEVDHLLQRISSHLKPGGIIIAKTWLRLENNRPDLMQLIGDYRDRLSHKDFYSAICLPLFLHFYDYEKETVAVRDMSREMKELHKKGIITSQEWETIKRHAYENVTLQLYIPHIKDLKSLVVKYFSLDEIVNAGFDYSQLHPILVLRSRQN